MTRPQIRHHKLTIPAGSSRHIDMPATLLRCIEASDLFQVELDHGTSFDFAQGLGLNVPEGFKKATFTNRSDAVLTIRVLLGEGLVHDSRLSLPDDLVTLSAGANAHFNSVELTSGERVLLLPEDPTRLEVTISNEGGAPVYIGDENVSFWGARMAIAPGYERTIKTTSEIHAYSQAAGVQIIQVMENKR